MPETLIFTTSDPYYGKDDVLIQRSRFGGSIAYLQVTEASYGTGSAFLTLEEAIAARDQLSALIQDALENKEVTR